ncbi:hypothetical protein [Celeribacter naphthalenivorans]|uniref:hypothetical protein n=1 Tax=Celeribacter naphthalenivorans TaxID=1614694 RepID=UPI001CFA131A|nr:hypothetical protein [Celeribacter naphthalenivorans]
MKVSFIYPLIVLASALATYIFFRVVYGDDPRAHFGKRAAGIVAIFLFILSAPLYLDELKILPSRWVYYLSQVDVLNRWMHLDAYVVDENQTSSTNTDKQDTVMNMLVVDQEARDGMYTSDLLLTQTSPQVSFACNPLMANVSILFFSDEEATREFEKIFGKDPISTIGASFLFASSGRAAVIKLSESDMVQTPTRIFYSDIERVQKWELEAIDSIFSRALKNEESFFVTFEKDGKSWQSKLISMDGAWKRWVDANSRRLGVPLAKNHYSDHCREMAARLPT